MAVESLVFPVGIQNIMLGDIILAASGGSDLIAVLVLDTYTADDAHADRADLNEASGESYAEIALTEADPTVTDNEVFFDVGNATITFASPTSAQVCGGMAICINDGGDDLMICTNEFTSAVTSNGTNDIIVTPNVNGLFKVTCSGWS